MSLKMTVIVKIIALTSPVMAIIICLEFNMASILFLLRYITNHLVNPNDRHGVICEYISFEILRIYRTEDSTAYIEVKVSTDQE